VRDQVENQLGIGCALKKNSFIAKPFPQSARIGEVAVVTNGQISASVVNPERLNIGRIF
jgi:hypothetical protein